MKNSNISVESRSHRKNKRFVDPELEAEAKNFWRNVVVDPTSPLDVGKAVNEFAARYRAAWSPPAFAASGDARVYGGVCLLGGRRRLDGADPVGTLGKLAHALECRVCMTLVRPEMVGIELPDDAIHDAAAIDLFAKMVARYVSGAHVFFAERGEKGKRRLHGHVLHAPGCCSVGHSSPIITPKRLLKIASYLAKKPIPTKENMIAYARTVRENGRVTKRLRAARLGRSHVTLAEVEAGTGLRLRRPMKALTVFEPFEITTEAEQIAPLVVCAETAKGAFQIGVHGAADLLQKIAAFEGEGRSEIASELRPYAPGFAHLKVARALSAQGIDPAMIGATVGKLPLILLDPQLSHLGGHA